MNLDQAEECWKYNGRRQDAIAYLVTAFNYAFDGMISWEEFRKIAERISKVKEA